MTKVVCRVGEEFPKTFTLLAKDAACHCWRNIASLTMSGGVKQFSNTLQHALVEERHFALVEAVAFANICC
jgi:hypothetical protein